MLKQVKLFMETRQENKTKRYKQETLQGDCNPVYTPTPYNKTQKKKVERKDPVK